LKGQAHVPPLEQRAYDRKSQYVHGLFSRGPQAPEPQAQQAQSSKPAQSPKTL